MTPKRFQSEILKRVDELLSNLSKERLRDVVERRFGLKNGTRETLEAIGQNYGITRERVRQIENDAFKILSEQQKLAVLKPIFDYLDNLFEEHDYLIGEEKLLSSATSILEPDPSRAAVVLVLTLGKPYQRFGESDKFHPHWTTKKTIRKNVEKIVDYLVEYFDKQNQLYSLEDILNSVLAKHSDATENIILNAIDIAKRINKNIFGELGLKHWAEVNPKGVRDKAYLVLKKEAEPCHFTEITDLINKASFSSRQAFSQTVHNELIKDDRFILIGRGMYALKEWGFEPGIVKEVIAKTLSKANKPLTKDEIVSAVLQQRRVKPNTVVINLQNSSGFERLDNGKYRLVV